MVTSSDFRQIYCSRNGISESDYAEHLLQKALPAHARAFRSLSLLFLQNKNHFRSDFDFINDVGCLRNYRDFNQSVDEFYFHPWNQRTLLRGLLRLRVSTNRVRRIVREQLKTGAEAQPPTAPTSATVPTRAALPASTAHTNGILSDEHKALIKERLEQRSHASPPPQLVGTPANSPSAHVPSPALHFVSRRDRTRTATVHQASSHASTEAELEVLRVVNERLKSDLERITAQRDILKKAAAILASS